MQISGSDLLPFSEAQSATREHDEKTVNGIRRDTWRNMQMMDTIEAELCPCPYGIVPDLIIGRLFVPLRSLKSEAIRSLGLHQRPKGVAA